MSSTDKADAQMSDNSGVDHGANDGRDELMMEMSKKEGIEELVLPDELDNEPLKTPPDKAEARDPGTEYPGTASLQNAEQQMLDEEVKGAVACGLITNVMDTIAECRLPEQIKETNQPTTSGESIMESETVSDQGEHCGVKGVPDLLQNTKLDDVEKDSDNKTELLKNVSEEDNCEKQGDVFDIIDKEKVKGSHLFLENLVEDVTSDGQQSTSDGQDEMKQAEKHTVGSEKVCGKKGETEVNINCQLQESVLEVTDKESNSDSTSSIKIAMDVNKDKDTSPRNVFDAFPINMASDSKTVEVNLSQGSNYLNDIASSNDDHAGGSDKEMEQKISECTDGIDSSNTQEAETKLIGTIKKTTISKKGNASYDETQTVDNENSQKEKSDSSEATKTSTRNNRNKKEQKQIWSQEKGVQQESDILKKAKEKYNLKELRISLHTTEVKDCGETISTVQNEKGVVKVPKVKQTNEQSITEKQKKDIKVSFDQNVSKSSDSKDDLIGQNKCTDLLHDNDSAKPLKKRGRRGYEDQADIGKSDQEVIGLSCETPEKKTEETDVVTGHLSSKNEHGTANEILHETNVIESVIKVVRRKERKGKKGKRKSKSTSKNHTKESLTPVVTENEIKVSEEKGNSETVEPLLHIVDNNNTEAPADISLESNNTPSTLQLKKYPGRSCKLRNQLPQIPLKPKKSKSQLKTRIIENHTGNELKPVVDSPVKIKKKRKRKVKPWSWGNEKKKYKPKAKLSIGERTETLAENTMLDDSENLDTRVLNIAEEISEANHSVIHSVSKSDESIGISNNNCNIPGEMKDSSVFDNVDETKDLTMNDSVADSSNVKCFDRTKTIKNSGNKRKKKGKRVKKPRSEHTNYFNTLNKNDYEQTNETLEIEKVNVSCNQSVEESQDLKSQQLAEDETFAQGSLVNTSLKTNENVLNETIVEQSVSELKGSMTEKQQEVLAGSSQVNDNTDLKLEVPKRKRGRPGRPKKGEGKGKTKRRKLEPTTYMSTLNALDPVGEGNDSDLRSQAIDAVVQNQEHSDIIDAANLIEQVDNELPVDNYPHVSPDSGIQSLAGSPAGNESPNSVIINVENSINSSTSTSHSKQHNESLSKENKYPSGSSEGLVSVLDSAPVLTSEQVSKHTEVALDSNHVPNDKNFEISNIDSDVQKPVKEKTRKCSTSDNSKDATSCSPSKKKNRAKFLQLHKTSTLLQKGRLPTEEEKEKRLDDKFDYPEKITDKLSASPPIDLYSQHMNSFQVTLGTCEGVSNSLDIIDKEFIGDNAKTVNKSSSKKAGKKPRSKHKTKRKNASESAQTTLLEKSDLQEQTDLLLKDSCAPMSVVRSSSTVISDYSPIYHSSSVLTPVSLTLSSVAMTDTVTTCSSVMKSIASAVETVSESAEVSDTVLNQDKISSNWEETVTTVPSVEIDKNETIGQSQMIDGNSFETESASVLSQARLVPLKKKRGRSSSKHKGVLAVKGKTLNKAKKNITTSTVKKLNLLGEKRSRGRPKGSKNKNKSLKEREKALAHPAASGDQQDEMDSKVKAGRAKRVLSPAKDGNSQSLSPEKVKKNKLENENLTKSDLLTEKGSCPNFSNTMMEWRESSVLGPDKEDKKKRGPGRPRKHPKKPAPKKSVKKGLVNDSLNTDSIGIVRIDHENHSEGISMDLSAGPMDEPPILEMFKDDDLALIDESIKQLPKIRKSKLHPMLKKGKRGRKKGYTAKKNSEQSVEIGIDEEVAETEDLVNLTDLQPARSVSSHDSDTSGAGSSFGSKSFQVQMWMEFSKHKRRKNKQKLRYFRSKHKNIIDPVFIAKVDCLIDDFPQLSISPPSETYLKVRPGEVPLPSIFKIVRINIKKKKKDKLFVFEKAKPLKSKNELELGPKDKIKLARKIGDHLMDLSGVSYHQRYNLPPKKRHKLFSGLGPDDSYSGAEPSIKPEKRKAGRPRKVRPPSPEQSTSFSFGEVHKAKQGFQMGKEATEPLASFASVAAQSGQSPNTSFSPEKTSPHFSPTSPRTRDIRADKHHTLKSSNKSHTSASTNHKNVPSSDKVNEICDKAEKSKPSSCNKCSELQASVSEQSYVDTKVNSPKVVNNIHLKRKVKRLKRKYRRSKKLTKIKRKVVKPVETLTNEDSLDPDSSVRSVCSESEPLPSIYLDKRKHDSDSEDDSVKEKRPKLIKRRKSDTSQESGDTATVQKKTGPFNQKKKYQKAGLYSDSYKDDEKSEAKPKAESYFTFDLPLHFGQHQLKNTVTDFQLPYDVWWLHFNNMLPKKGDGKQYRRIRNNIYVDAKPSCRYEAHACSCRKPLNPNEKGCGEDCINRLVYTECSADMCPCYDQCSNQSIQKHQFASGLQRFLTKDRGFGVRTSKPLRLGQLIVEYCGEVVSEQEFRRRMTEEYSQDRNHYCLNLDKGMVIDGYRKGNIARFVNHSCEPNCEMQKWTVTGVYHMCLFALRDIEPGEELVYDYNFQSFNHDAQQLCNCGSKECRGIIGGKKQWFNGQGKSAEKSGGKKGKHPKDKRKSKQKLDKMKDKNKKSLTPGNHQGMPTGGNNPIPPYFSYPIKPLLKKEKVFARKHSIFLVRNFDRIRGLRHDQLDQSNHKVTKDDANFIKGTHFTKRDIFIAQLTALKTSRSMKTRRLTVAEEDTEVGKMARIAGVCKEIYSSISSAKDDEGNFLATDLYHLPSKKKHPRYYQVIDEPIDLTMMQKKILTGTYESVELFEKDMLKLFQNVEIYCGKKSEMGDKIRALRDVFSTAKREGMTQIQELLGAEPQSDVQTGALSDVDMQVATPTASVSSESDISESSDNKVEWMQGEDDEEEIIRCICGIYKDEGLMIQCDKCYIWQHTDCMRVKGDVRNYLCDQCDPRPVNREVELVPNAEGETEASGDGNRYFMTLMRDDMQIRLGSCVYVMKENQSRRNSYKKSGGLDKDRMDIFRIERMWKNRKGEKFAFGHMYILPHETFHEPNRKFFPNEVFRTPLYEMFHLESITGYCCVLDLLTYCKGKPKGYKDEDLYICEYRMDKTLHLFYKISSKQRCSVNTRSYCFEMYEKRLNPKRTYSPHEVPEAYKRNWREKSSGSIEDSVQEKKPVSDEEEDVPLVKVKIERRKEKRERVNKLVDSLSKGKLSPSKKRTDLTYLLTD